MQFAQGLGLYDKEAYGNLRAQLLEPSAKINALRQYQLESAKAKICGYIIIRISAYVRQINKSAKTFFKGKKFLSTGHTGFKGSWLCLWLHALGAEVTGYALEPPTEPSLFELARVDELVNSTIADVRDGERLKKAMQTARPEIVIHMAAQPLVRDSYKIPVETYAVNVMGTVHLLEAVRPVPVSGQLSMSPPTSATKTANGSGVTGKTNRWVAMTPTPTARVARNWSPPHTDTLFSTSSNPQIRQPCVSMASARAGNVIGGGDWATDRLISDCIRALLAGEKVRIRNPHAIRPWQHVLEPLSGYLLLRSGCTKKGERYAEGWNFGPNDDDAKPVEWIVQRLCEKWGEEFLLRVG